jgi:hypothetical protein
MRDSLPPAPSGPARLLPLLALVLLTLSGIGCRERLVTVPTPPPESRRTLLDREADAFFSGPIRTFEVTLGSNSLASLRQDPRKAVPATVCVGTNLFESVSVHVKGSAGSTRSVDDNPALTLNFGKYKDGQTAFGLHKLHLNNSVQDPSRMNELVASTLYRRSGIPTARAMQGLVILNGRDLGLYVVKEGYDKAFVRRNFPEDPKAEGNLYDGGFVRDIDQDLTREVGRGTNDYADLRQLRAAVNEGPATRMAAIERILDVDHFLTYCAWQSINDDWDGYPRNRNNYRLYRDPIHNRFRFIPHGMDQLYANPGQALEPGWAGVVAQRFFELPGTRDRFLDRITMLSTNYFTPAAITNLLNTATDRLTNALASRPEPERQEVLGHIRGLRSRLLERAAQIPVQMELRPRPIHFDERGEMTLGGWVPRPDTGNGVAEIVPLPSGGRAFHLVARSEATVAGFRAPIRLPAGDYVFSARLRTSQLKAFTDARGSGAGVRIGGGSRTNSLAGTTDWTLVQFPLHLPESRDLEWVVEIRADAGEAWAEMSSLKLRRISSR